MGTTSTELALPKIVEILAPEGEYEKKRIALRHEYAAVVTASRQLTSIGTAEQAEEATKYGRLLQVAAKETETFFAGIKRQVDDIKKPILAAEKEDSNPYLAEKSRLGGLLTSYQAEQRRIREEEERRAREAAQKQAEEEAIQRAIELAAAGDEEASEAALDEPIVAAPVVIPATATKPTGSVSRTYYRAQVVDFKALVAAVAAGTVPLMALQANEAFLNNQADQFKEALSYPGVKLDIKTSTSFRS